MEYGLRPDEPLAAGVQKVACEQIDRAIEQLSNASDPRRGVHEARKCMKRVRALLHLIRPAIGEKSFKSEDRRIRDIGRTLSGPRDSQAIIEAVAKLENGSAPSWDSSATQALKARLLSERKRAERELYRGILDKAAADLAAIREHYQQLKLQGRGDKIGDGLERSYRRARQDYKRAYRRKRPEDFHEWRKSAQRHWRQMQLLWRAWPDALDARIEAAGELSRLLGEDHDFAVLMDRVATQKKSLGEKWDMKAFLAACTAHQGELRRPARDLGKFLFVERPRNFRERMDAYWQAARDLIKSSNGTGAASAILGDEAEHGETESSSEPDRPGAA